MRRSIGAQIALNVRSLRIERGVSLTELARSAGVSKGTPYKLEDGSGNPTIETLLALAEALDVSFNDIVTSENSQVRVVRATEGRRLQGSATELRLMDHLLGKNIVDVHEVVFAEGEHHHSEAHATCAVEHLFVIEGRLAVGPSDEVVEVEAGDYVTFPVDTPHSYEAIGGKARAVLLISYMDTPSSRQQTQQEPLHNGALQGLSDS